jgi:hypothetical protein
MASFLRFPSRQFRGRDVALAIGILDKTVERASRDSVVQLARALSNRTRDQLCRWKCNGEKVNAFWALRMKPVTRWSLCEQEAA